MGLLDAPVSARGIGRALARNTSKNLFDPRVALDGWYVEGTGGWVRAPFTGVSGLIPVTTGVQYAGTHQGTSNAIRMHCFFAVDGTTVVPGGSSNPAALFTAPAGAAFVRVTYNISATLARWLFQVEAGGAGTAFVPFNGSGPLEGVFVSDQNIFALDRSVNLFDPVEAVDGLYLTNEGNFIASAAFGVSGYIPVEPNAYYRASDWVGFTSGGVGDTNVLRFTTYYDADKNVIAGGSSSSTNVMTTTATTRFVRVTYNIVTTNGMTSGKASLQIERTGFTGVATKYVPFGRQLARPMNSDRRTPQVPMWGASRLRMWNAWKLNPSGAFNITFHGDSYTDGNYFCKKVRNALLVRGFGDGGPGWLGFWTGDGVLATQSIDTALLSCAFTTGDWTNVSATSSWGPSFTHVVSTGASKVITVTAGTALATCTVVFKTQPGGAGFTYAINGGGATSVSTNAAAGVGTAAINTSGAGSSFTITITSSGSGVEIAGLIGRKSGSNLLTVNKAGLTGSHASMCGKLSPYQAAAATLTTGAKNLKFYMWSVNDQNANILPSVVKGHIQNLVNIDRTNDAYCDLVFIAPPETTYSTGKDYPMTDYAEVMYQLARENEGAAFIDLGAIFGRYSAAHITSGLFNGDAVHPGSFGEWLIADQPIRLLA